MQRKKIFSLAILLLTAFSIFGQRFTLGLRAGFSLSDLAIRTKGVFEEPIGQLWPNYRPLAGYHVGLTSRLRLNGRWSALTELNYERKGGSTGFLLGSSAQTLEISDWTHELHYVGIAILADGEIARGLSLQAGLQPGFLTAARGKSKGENIDLREDFFEDFDLGAVAGFEWRFGRGFFLGGRYVWGLLPVSDVEYTNEEGQPVDHLRSFNRDLQVSAGYRFRL